MGVEAIVSGPGIFDGHCHNYRAIARGAVFLAMRKRGFVYRILENSQATRPPASL